MVMIEGEDPSPIGLITPDALSPCLFTLLQQPREEGVNKASSQSTASNKISARNICSLSGPCQTSLPAKIQQTTIDPCRHLDVCKTPCYDMKRLLHDGIVLINSTATSKLERSKLG